MLRSATSSRITCAWQRPDSAWRARLTGDLGRRAEVHHRVFELVRHRGTVRSASSLCWPRGHSVDVWHDKTLLVGAAVPPHPHACAPGMCRFPSESSLVSTSSVFWWFALSSPVFVYTRFCVLVCAPRVHSMHDKPCTGTVTLMLRRCKACVCTPVCVSFLFQRVAK
jgi:hypothetical protein